MSSLFSSSSSTAVSTELGVTWVTLQELKAADAHKQWSVADPSKNANYVLLMKADYSERVNPQPQYYRRGEPKMKFKPALETVMFFEGQTVAEGVALTRTGNGLYQAFMNAWAYHEGVVVSPDDIWIAVQGLFCKYIEAHAEELRSLFVDHQGKKKLEVCMDDAGYNWSLFMDRVVVLIRQSVKNSVDDDFLPKFSSSTPLDLAMKHLAVMDAMKQYFSYGMSCMCGIPKVGFVGTVPDWVLLKETVARLKRFAVKDDAVFIAWVDKVGSIIDQFVLTMEGIVNLSFWNGVVQKRSESGSGASSYIKGWLNALLVMDFTPELDVKKVPSTRFNVPVDVNDNGNKFKVTIVGGFSGVVYDPAKTSWTPYRSYAVVAEDKGEPVGEGKAEEDD